MTKITLIIRVGAQRCRSHRNRIKVKGRISGNLRKTLRQAWQRAAQNGGRKRWRELVTPSLISLGQWIIGNHS